MKSNNLRIAVLVMIASVLSMSFALAQSKMQYFRQNDQRGIGQFEAPKEAGAEFEDVHVKIGGSSTIQFQGLSHENAEDSLAELGKNFNLPTANLDIDVQLYQGVRMHLRTYLSSRHHAEAWVKGGYIQIDELDFIKEDFLASVMSRMRLKIGHMEINYGDLHFKRSDNAQAIYNPFVGNYLFDSFSTEVAGEVYYLHNGIIAMVGVSNGRLNQSVTNTETSPAFYGKLGFDKQFSDDLRFRLTGSLYATDNTNSIYLYDGDRSGARYYNVMQRYDAGDNFRSGRVDPGYSSNMTSVMINPFLKFKGLEVMATYENSTGGNDPEAGSSENRSWNHIAAEVIYRIGEEENVFIGGRYNSASGEMGGAGDEVSINRINLGAGWFLTKNILAKLEYVNQSYNDYPAGSLYEDGKFNGVMLEAAISF